ncbi:MAG: methyltransferase domain-containing protein [Patescibacteria group bacterium]
MHSDTSSTSDTGDTRTYVSLLGRQPELSLAELEQVFGHVIPLGDIAATFEHHRTPNIQRLGGSTKLGEVVAEFETQDWARLSNKIVRYYTDRLKDFDGKVTLGMSVYGREVHPREVQRTGLMIKSALKKKGVSMRLIPNDFTELSTATSHHNKLGLSPNKIELLVIYENQKVLVAESRGTQNITALAARDQARPKTDAYVGMLPPKLALMMINLSGITASGVSSPEADITARPSSGTQPERSAASSAPDSDIGESGEHGVRILDPFCGTGVVLQEAALLGFDVYGTDLAEKMVDYSRANLDWLAGKHSIGTVTIEAGDAIEHTWHQPIDAVVAETYLGQPFSAPPAPDKLDKVRRVVDHITTSFLENIAHQLEPGTPLCLAVPVWRDGVGRFTFLPVINKIESLGYEWHTFETVNTKQLAYFREDQIVARQLLVLTRR